MDAVADHPWDNEVDGPMFNASAELQPAAHCESAIRMEFVT